MTPAASCGAPSTASPPPWPGERALHALRADAARLMMAGGPPRELVRARPARLQLPPGGVFSLLLLCYGNLPPPSASPSPPPPPSASPSPPQAASPSPPPFDEDAAAAAAGLVGGVLIAVIVAPIVGFLLLVALIVVCICCCCKQNKTQASAV